MTHTRDRSALHLVRYGIPALVLVFYLSAVARYNYTPESVFAALGPLAGHSSPEQGGSVSPLWALLVGGARAAGAEPVKAAKALGLLLGSGAILLAFLTGVEMLRDRVPAFLVALIVAAQNGLLLAAVSGHPLTLLLALTLGAVFLLQRNHYTASALLMGCASLVAWQAILLVPVLAGDAVINSPARRTGIGRALAAVATAAGPPALWIVVASLSGYDLLPVMPAAGELWTTTPTLLFIPVLLLVAAVAGLGLLVTGSAEERRIFLALFPAVGGVLVLGAGGMLGNAGPQPAVFPLLCGLGFFGLGVVFSRLDRERWLTPSTILLAGVFLLLNQIGLYGEPGDRIAETSEENAQIATISVWLRRNTDAGETISSDRPATLSWFLGRTVPTSGPSVDQVRLSVAAASPGPGFFPVYRTGPASDSSGHAGNGYAVWRRK